jgi:hypothetical protein
MTYTRTCTQAQVGITGKHFSDGSFGMGLTIPLTATAIWVRLTFRMGNSLFF